MKYATIVTMLTLAVGISAEGVLESRLNAEERSSSGQTVKVKPHKKVDCASIYELAQEECVKLDDLAQDRTSRRYGEDLDTCPKEETPSRWECQDDVYKRMQTRKTVTQENWDACLDKAKRDYDRCMKK